MGKKNLEQLFKDTFKDFHEVPDEKVWKSIEATLDKKKDKKRVIPIWWKLGGVAALFAILFFAINPLDKSDNSDGNRQIEVVETEGKNEVFRDSKDSVNISNDEVVTEQVDETIERQEGIRSNKSLNEANRGIANSEKSNPEKRFNQKTTVSNPDSELASVQERKENTDNIEQKSPLKKVVEDPVTKSEEAVAGNDLDSQENQQRIDQDPMNKELDMKSSEVAQIENEDKKQEEEETLLEKKSIYDAIAEKNAAEEEEELLAQNDEGKWSVGPSVAPVYFTGTGEGSPIHSNFSSNSKSGNVNLSYGLTVSYNLGKRLKVRSGVHRVDYGYDTNEIVFSSSLQGSTNELIDNIDYASTSRNLVVQSSKSLPNAAVEADSFSELQASESPALDGKMVQQLGYIEVPLELNYALIDKKLGVDIIGGVSSLFLVDNTILLESEDLVTEVGEANNANSVNFSTNVGVGLNYEISPKVQLNLEPVFKYQLNTFSETAGPFRPFSVGVYSGVSFKF